MLRNSLFSASKWLLARPISTSAPRLKTEDRKAMMRSMPKPDEGIAGSNIIALDATIEKSGLFPDEDTPNRIFNGVAFKDLPIVNIKTTKNNTIINVCEPSGTTKLTWSCGCEGFKNTRKGTNIAAQAAATTIATKAVARGFLNVRVTVQGLGPGRMSAIKGLTIGGMNVVSITDTTRVSWNPPRARKVRRL